MGVSILGVKFCEKCRLPADMTLLECPSCSNSSFIHNLPETENLNENSVQSVSSECTNCKTTIAPNSKFCNHCGESQFKEKVTFDSGQFNSAVPTVSKNNSNLLYAIILLIIVGIVLLIANSNKSSSFGTDGDYSSGNSENSTGHWITNCTTSQVPNPNYGGPDPMYEGSIIDRHKTINVRQCFQEYVYD